MPWPKLTPSTQKQGLPPTSFLLTGECLQVSLMSHHHPSVRLSEESRLLHLSFDNVRLVLTNNGDWTLVAKRRLILCQDRGAGRLRRQQAPEPGMGVGDRCIGL